MAMVTWGEASRRYSASCASYASLLARSSSALSTPAEPSADRGSPGVLGAFGSAWGARTTLSEIFRKLEAQIPGANRAASYLQAFPRQAQQYLLGLCRLSRRWRAQVDAVDLGQLRLGVSEGVGGDGFHVARHAVHVLRHTRLSRLAHADTCSISVRTCIAAYKGDIIFW